MAINSHDDYLSSFRQMVPHMKTASLTSVAGIWFSGFALAGNPPAGTLAVGNTLNGIVPTSSSPAGYPGISAFPSGGKGYLTRFGFSSSVACNIQLVDKLFSAGAYAFNASASLGSQPSFASRVPLDGGGVNPDYRGLEIWLETVTAFTGNQSIRIVYTGGDGNSKDTGVIATGVAPTVARIFRVPMVDGTGVQRIDQIISSVATVGTFNVHVVRPLTPALRVPVAYYAGLLDILGTGMPEVFATSALDVVVAADSTARGLPTCYAEIAAK